MRKLFRSEAEIQVAFSVDMETPLLYGVPDFAARPPPTA